MRVSLIISVAVLVAACAPEVPDSAAGVGFGDYQEYQQAREAQLSGDVVNLQLPPDTPQQAPESGPEFVGVPAGTLPNPASAPVAPVQTASAPAQVAEPNNPSISDEQDFGAVSLRESIESDRERLAAQREQYQVIEPKAVPVRPGTNGADIVQFALSTTNALGERIYRRSGRVDSARFLANCAKYTSSDQAQQAFLKAGGPDRDRLNIDPDGDGFACFWDPAPFRLAQNR